MDLKFFKGRLMFDLSRYKWLKWVLVALYLAAKYIVALRRGRLDPPCIRQFITVCIGAGLTMLYYASGINKGMNTFINQLSLVGITTATMYVHAQVNAKTPKPDTDYLLTKYKRLKVPEDSPEDCVVCLDLVTSMYYGLQCKRCKHTFHKKCLRKWCDESASCPHCRYEYR